MTFDDWAHAVGHGFDVAAVLVLVVSFVSALVHASLLWRTSGSIRRAYRNLRETFGGGLLIALEILVAADLVGTVAVSPTIENIAVLGLIVLIRTFLSFSLETEIEGVFPWRRAATPRPFGVGDDRLIPRGGRRDSAAGPA